VSGYYCSLSGGIVTWSAWQQKTIALSTCEAEYVAAAEARKEIKWIHTVLHELRFTQSSASLFMCDNNRAIILTEDNSFHTHVKHIDMAYHSICKGVLYWQLKWHYVWSKENIADIFTKALAKPDFMCLCAYLGLQWFGWGGVSHVMSKRSINAWIMHMTTATLYNLDRVRSSVVCVIN
jgi:hypothetical protein